MTILASFFSEILGLFQLPITVYGFTFSFWDVFMFNLIVSVICWIIGGFFDV